MNIFEFLVFLFVTATIGTIIGCIVGLFTGEIGAGAKLGAFLGPIVAATGITFYLFFSKIKKSRAHKSKDQNKKSE